MHVRMLTQSGGHHLLSRAALTIKRCVKTLELNFSAFAVVLKNYLLAYLIFNQFIYHFVLVLYNQQHLSYFCAYIFTFLSKFYTVTIFSFGVMIVKLMHLIIKSIVKTLQVTCHCVWH